MNFAAKIHNFICFFCCCCFVSFFFVCVCAEPQKSRIHSLFEGLCRAWSLVKDKLLLHGRFVLCTFTKLHLNVSPGSPTHTQRTCS